MGAVQITETMAVFVNLLGRPLCSFKLKDVKVDWTIQDFLEKIEDETEMNSDRIILFLWGISLNHYKDENFYDLVQDIIESGGEVTFDVTKPHAADDGGDKWIIVGTKKKFDRIKVQSNITRDITELALKHHILNFTYDVESFDGKRNFSVDVYQISKEALCVRFEADENLNIKVFQTVKRIGTEVEVPVSFPGAFNEANLQSNLDRHVKKSIIFKNYGKGIGTLIGAAVDIAGIAMTGTPVTPALTATAEIANNAISGPSNPELTMANDIEPSMEI